MFFKDLKEISGTANLQQQQKSVPRMYLDRVFLFSLKRNRCMLQMHVINARFLFIFLNQKHIEQNGDRPRIRIFHEKQGFTLHIK